MTKLFLVSVSAPANAGIDGQIFSALAAAGAELLDIGQSAIHRQVSFGAVVSVADEAALRGAVTALQQADLQISCEPLSSDQYRDWVSQQANPHYVVTVLGRTLGAQQMAAVTDALAQHSLELAQMQRLSERMPLAEDTAGVDTRACVELVLRDGGADEAALRKALFELGNELALDIAVQRDSAFRRNRRLVVFDMDSTLIQAEVIDELAKAAGVGDQVVAITESAMRGELDFTESFAKRLGLLKGLDASVLEGIAESLQLTEGCERLVSTLHKLGFKTAIVSGGFNYFGRYLQQKLGFNYVFANELEVVDGKVTGEVRGTVVDGQRKAALLRELAEKEGLSLQQVIAVGDGANDLPMLGIAGLGVAFRAKPLVKATAKQSISTLGLDGVLYLLGLRDRDIASAHA